MVLGNGLGQAGGRLQLLSGDQQIVAQAAEKRSVSRPRRACLGMKRRITPKSNERVFQPTLLCSKPVVEIPDAGLVVRTCQAFAAPREISAALSSV